MPDQPTPVQFDIWYADGLYVLLLDVSTDHVLGIYWCTNIGTFASWRMPKRMLDRRVENKSGMVIDEAIERLKVLQTGLAKDKTK